MIRFEYTDTHFNKNDSKDLDLSILSGMDSLIFTVAEKTGKILALKDYQLAANPDELNAMSAALSAIFRSEELLLATYDKVTYTISNKSFVFVPDKFFIETEAPAYIAQAMQLSGEYEVAFSEVADFHSKLVFAFPKLIHETVKSYQASARISHGSKGLFRAYQANKNSNPQNYFGLHFRGRVQFVSLVQDGFLRFHNAYGADAPNDALYFLLLAADQMHINPAEMAVLISGDIRIDSEIIKLVKRYFQSVNYFSGSVQEENLEKISYHLYADALGALIL